MSNWIEELETDIERLEDEVERLKAENEQIQLAVVHKRFTVEDTVTGKQLKWWGAEEYRKHERENARGDLIALEIDKALTNEALGGRERP